MPGPYVGRAMSRMSPEEQRDLHLDRTVLRRAWTFARPYRTRLILNGLGLAASAGLATLVPLVFKHLLDSAIPNRDFGEVNLLFVAAVVLAFLVTAFEITNRWLNSTIGEGLIFDLRVKLYEHITRMPVSFFTRTQTGSLLSRLSTDVVGAQATVTTMTTFLSDIFTLVITLFAMAFLSWQVTLLALIVIPIFVILDRLLGRRLAALSRRRMDKNADMTSTMQERFNVSGAILVKLFGRPKQEVDNFGTKADGVKRIGVQIAVTGRAYYGALVFTGALGTALVYWLGSRAVINGAITIGTLTALAAYVARLYQPLTGLASARIDLLGALVSFDRCFEVLDAPLSITEKPNAQRLERPRGEITFDNVSFRYPGNTNAIASLESSNARTEGESPEILHHVNLQIPAGATVALVGRSGAGKTTLSSLIPRLYDVTDGAVLLDGIDVRDLTLQSVSDAIGVVSQDTHVFHDTVAANLRFARPAATEAEMLEACKRARIHDVITALPHGYDTVVGERGYRLSGGEKQRLAIARVLLKAPAIVVLDEATAHLDSGTEHLVQEALAEALEGRTAVVIAHRLSTIRAADLIVVLEGGRVIEQGTHEELLTADGSYAGLHELQYR